MIPAGAAAEKNIKNVTTQIKMKISAWVFATDLLPNKKTFTERLTNKGNLFDKTSTKEVFAKLKASDVDGIELLIPANFSDEDFQRIKKILDENNVIVNSIHQPLRLITKTDVKEIEMLFSVAKKFKAKLIVLHLYNAKGQISSKSYLDALHKLQTDYGIKISFENTQKFAQVFNQKRYWDSKTFSDVVKSAGFTITLDTTHLADAGGDMIEFYNQNKNNIVNIQLSDYKTKWPKPCLHLQPGKGTLPMDEFLRVLKDNKYDGFITMEIKTDLEGLCESAKFIRQGLS
jgi:sugar phosphate isomerase/epimerase